MTNNTSRLKEIIKNSLIYVRNINEAYYIAYLMFDYCNFQKDKEASENAGYSIFRDVNNFDNYICDLESRLECNFADGSIKNIWIN